MTTLQPPGRRDGAVIRIVLVDDKPPLRQEIRKILEGTPGLKVVGEADDGSTVVRLATRLKPDLFLMDVMMSGIGGIEATQNLHERYPAIKVIALSLYGHREFVRGMFDAGATGFVRKDEAATCLIAAIDTVFADDTYLSPGCRI